MLLPLATGSRKGKAFSVDTELLVNWYPEISQNKRARSLISLHPRPGMKLLGNYGASPARGLHATQVNLYAGLRGELKRITTDGAATIEGTLDTTTGNMSFADNGDQVLLVDGISGYVYTESTDSFAKITDADFPAKPEHVSYQDGFFLVNAGGTQKWYKSALKDGASWDALDFASAQKDPDNLRTLIGDGGEIWLFGDKSAEVWQNVGGTDFPFQRLDGAHIQRGIHAPWSLARFADGLAALMVNPEGGLEVVHLRNYQPVRISDDAMETRIEGFSSSVDAKGFTFATPGHQFLVLSFPTAGESWMFDIKSREWTELRTGRNGRWVPEHRQSLSGTAYVSDYTSGNIFSLDTDTYDDNGAPLYRKARGYHLAENDEYLFHHELEIFFERGVALSTGQGSDPQAMLRWSDDGGRTWSSEHWRSIGLIGEYERRARWGSLGMTRDRVYELNITDPVNSILAGARFDIG